MVARDRCSAASWRSRCRSWCCASAAAQFAIGTWVVAEALAIYVSFDSALGAGHGHVAAQLDALRAAPRQHYTYWLTLACRRSVSLASLFVLLRSRLGSSLQAIRDDEDAAASVGVRVVARQADPVRPRRARLRRGGRDDAREHPLHRADLDLQRQLQRLHDLHGARRRPRHLRGPIIGAIIFYVIQKQFGNDGTWYLVGLGATAIVFALLLPRGLWGLLTDRLHFQLLPVGYRVEQTERAAEGAEG